MKEDNSKLSVLKDSVDTNGNYINCDFIEGTAFKNESIWSMATKILCINRAGMTPVWFETILFLRPTYTKYRVQFREWTKIKNQKRR